MTSPDADPPIIEHHLPVTRTARYCTLGGTAPRVDDVWIVCHGFGQLAREFAEEFRPIARPGRLIVAPEALNRFYLNSEGGRAGASARVGATWMTREDRLTEIDDYVRYLDDLLREVLRGQSAHGVRVSALGFSQGTATVGRWAVQGTSRLTRVILWAGALPPEIDPAASRARLAAADLHLVFGTRDEMLNQDEIRTQRATLDRAAVPHTVHEFAGGHRMDRATLERLAR